MTDITRARYAQLFGPTAGDRIRLPDTNLLIEVEHDHCGGSAGGAGEEVLCCGGTVMRQYSVQSVPPRPDGTPHPRLTPP